MQTCLIPDDNLKLTLMKYIDECVPQVIATETGMKYKPSSGKTVPHYRLMKIWHSCKRARFDADVVWWMDRMRTNGVPQCIWMAEIAATSVELLWKSFGNYRGFPGFKKEDSTLESVVTIWVEHLLTVKHLYYRELDNIARTNPEVVWSVLEPVQQTRTAAAVPSSSSFIPATQLLTPEATKNE